MTDPLGDLFRRHVDDVRQFLATVVHVDVLDDCVSEVFVRAIRKHPNIPFPEIQWLLRQAVLVARRAVTAPHSPPEGEPSPPSMNLEERERLQDVADALAGMSPADREALGLAVLGLESDEAAVICGCSPEAFRVRLHRARTRLRRTLEESTRDPEVESER